MDSKLRRASTIAVMAALGMLIFAVSKNHTIPHLPAMGEKSDATITSGNWTPNETVTGTILAANFAQDRRDWALANTYLSRLTNPNASDPLTALRMMLLALSAGQFDSAAANARHLDELSNTAAPAGKATQAPVTALGDGRDLAVVVLIAQSVRKGDLAAAEQYMDDMRAPALRAFVAPVLDSWIRAGLKQKLDGRIDGLSLLQALHRGLAAEWAGQIDTSNRVFDALAKVPLTPSGTLMIAAYNIRQNRPVEARRALEEAVRLNPMDVDAKAMLDAVSHNQMPPLKPRYNYHMQGVSAGIGLAFMDLAQSMVSEHANDTALIFAQIGRMVRQDVPGLGLLVGALFEEQKRTDDAAAVYAAIQPSDIDYVEAQIRLSSLRAEAGDTETAIKILDGLLARQANPRVAYALGEIYRQTKDYTKAVAAYDKAIELSGGKADDDMWSVYFVRAMAYDELKQWPKAEADLQTALKYRPENPQVLNFLGYSWADKGLHLTDARDMLIRAIARAPEDAYITDSLGWVFFRLGDLPQATELLERAVSLKPYDPVLNDHLGDVYAHGGRTLEARYQWQRSLDYADKAHDEDLMKRVTTKLETGMVGDGDAVAAQEK